MKLFTITFCVLAVVSPFVITYWRIATPHTGRTILVRRGDHWRVACECRFFGVIIAYRWLGRYESVVSEISSDKYSVAPLDRHGRFGYTSISEFSTPERAEQAAIEWRTQEYVKELTHQHDGQKEQITAPA